MSVTVTGDGDAETHSRDFAADPVPVAALTSASQHHLHHQHEQTEDGSPSINIPSPHVHYALQIDTDVNNITGASKHGTPTSTDPAAARNLTRTDTDRSAVFTPIMRRRTGRAGTFKTLNDFDDFKEVRPGWQPGAEPGVDPTKADGGHAFMPTLSARCDITIVDFSQDRISTHRKDNDTLDSFLQLPQPKWVKCRWINVNRLSWDVIKALGRHKNLHKLSLEDLMNTRNRTKAEWFPNHAFIILTLQKLVRRADLDEEDSDSDNDAVSLVSGWSTRSQNRVSKTLKGLFKSNKRSATDHPNIEAGSSNRGIKSQPTGFSDVPEVDDFRTLQQYHASPNDPRTEFMERHSALNSRYFVVACEQVSMFITHDNTVISFFEMSAGDIEKPIIRRLETNDTIIRRSCDASMVAQAIIDAVIDMAIPVTALYGDVIGDLELDVLTRANLGHTKKLYIVITEINKMLSFINPITTLLNTLRDHKTDMTQDLASQKLQDPEHGVIITPMTYTYLGDVLDHSVLITESFNQHKGSAEGMIDLIFNTIAAYQNESMKQLTVSTIIFLPLTFLTGYFGQNFDGFTETKGDVSYFWKIAIPVSVATILILLREVIWEYANVLIQRRYVVKLRQGLPRSKWRAVKRA